MLKEAATPSSLYRIGFWPDPLEWPPLEFAGGGRFDDPNLAASNPAQFRTPYAAENRRCCFVEALAKFRPSLEVLAREREISGTDDPVSTTTLPLDWCSRRCVGHFDLSPGQRWLDLRAFETREALRVELASTLALLALADFDMGDVLSRERKVTQAIAQWAYEQGYHGIVYSSRLDVTCNCWAIFDSAQFHPVDDPEPITLDDPDLRAVAAIYGLNLPLAYS